MKHLKSSSSSSKSSSRSRSRSRSRSSEKSSVCSSYCSSQQQPDDKLEKIQKEYDEFILKEKMGTFKRIEKYKTLNKPIKHQCNYCKRIWKPSPKQVQNDDYFCPSCALHHRNNMERFKLDRFKWTTDIPNTFYLYKITDPLNKKSYIKYGRTQHKSSKERYVQKEIDKYQMKCILNLRGPLKNMTAIENFWKTTANQYGLRPLFSEKDFHGATECIMADSQLQDLMISISNTIKDMDTQSYEDFDISLLEEKIQNEFIEILKKQENYKEIQTKKTKKSKKSE